MAYTQKPTKKKKSRFRIDLSNNTTRYSIILIAIIAIGIPVIAGVGLFSMYITAPPAGSESGWVTFELYDTQNGANMEGYIALTDFETGTLIGYYGNGSTIEIKTPALATVFNVSDTDLDGRDFLPMTIIPMTSTNQNNPQTNTIFVYFYIPTENVSVGIISLDGVEGDYDHDDMLEDVEMEIIIQFNVTVGNNNTIYGASSYVPECLLPTRAGEENITGFGLWLCLNETVVASALVNGEEGIFYYLADEDVAIIKLDSMRPAGQLVNQTIVFEIKTITTGMGIFEGFIDDLEVTWIDITAT